MPPRVKHSKIVQRRVCCPLNLTEFDRIGSDNSVSLVLVPRQLFCCYCCLNVPSGVYVLWQRFNAHQGLHPPGLILCWPFWNKISHVITQATKTYNAPVSNCPTVDNVMVSVDLSLTFHITNAEKFVYSLGAGRFDELLSAETEEAIRALVHAVPFAKVLDLREEFALGMLHGLNNKLSHFGVTFLNVKITDVILPPTLAETLENTTSFQSRMEQQDKRHQSEMRALTDEQARLLTQLKRKNERTVQELSANIQRANISREEQIILQKTLAVVHSKEAETRGNVRKVEARSELQTAENKLHTQQVEKVSRAKAELKTVEKIWSQRVINQERDTDAFIKSQENIISSLKLSAEVEGKFSTVLEQQRKFEVQNKELFALSKVSEKVSLVFGGKTGEELLRRLVDKSPAVIDMKR